MQIHIPNNFIQERKYIVEVIFSDFLGLEFEIIISESRNYQIVLNNGKIIEFEDELWSDLNEKDGFIRKENIPEKVPFAKNVFLLEKDIPIIFGNKKINTIDKKIICGIDIFASSFFMLTRWEEIVIEEKDKHNRFPCELSLAQKNNFHHRPIVNEYVEMLWNMLQKLGCSQKRKQRNFEIIPTHDIDFLFKFNSPKDLIKAVAGDLIKRKSIKLAFKTFSDYFKVKSGKIKDPYDTFDYFMNISEANNVKSNFYFIAGHKNEPDVRYNFCKTETKKIIENIISRGHKVGIHGGYSSFDNEKQFEKEVNRFKKFEVDVVQGRQHYLRFENPKTWRIWNERGMKYDSTIGYTNDSGFRAGVCYEYPVFDVIQRKKLNLIERPLIFMETVSKQKYHQKENFIKHCLSLKKTVKKYNGQFVFLWHNSNLNNYYWEEFKNVYPQIFE